MEWTSQQTGGASPSLERLAFYALRPGGWRDLGDAAPPPLYGMAPGQRRNRRGVAPHLYTGRLLATLAAFFLAVGVGRPCPRRAPRQTPGVPHLSSPTLWLSRRLPTGAVAIGVVGAVTISPTLIPFVIGVLIAPAYNLEGWWALSHDVLACDCRGGYSPSSRLTGSTPSNSAASALLAAGGCAMLLIVQRSLSTPVRELRRRTVSLTGEQVLSDGSRVPLDAACIAAPMERACSPAPSGWSCWPPGPGRAALQPSRAAAAGI